MDVLEDIISGEDGSMELGNTTALHFAIQAKITLLPSARGLPSHLGIFTIEKYIPLRQLA